MYIIMDYLCSPQIHMLKSLTFNVMVFGGGETFGK